MAGYIGSKASVVSSGAEHKKTFTITGATTSLTGLNYTVGKVHVFQNGVRLVDGTDYTATNGTTITLTVAAQSGDNVVVISQAGFQVADALLTSGGTMTGGLTVQGTVAATAVTGDGSGLTGTGSPSIVDNGNATAITIDSSETVGFGVTPSPWRNLYGDKQVDIGPHSSVYSEAGNTTFLANNFYRNASNAFIYKTTSGASYVSLAQEKIIFAGAASGTAGNSVSFSERARFDSDGLKFNGDTAAANALDDYEEGTWTPSPTNFSINSVSHATYVKIGKQVTLQGWVNNANGTGGANVAQLSGLPFSSVTYSVGNVNCANTNSNISRLHCRTVSGQPRLDFLKNNDEGVSGADIDAGYLIFTVTYTAS
jgi:hypothetical protein